MATDTSIPKMTRTPLGWWRCADAPARGDAAGVVALLRDVNRPVFAIQEADGVAFAGTGFAQLAAGRDAPHDDARPLLAFVPALHPASLGDSEFCAAHGVRYAYVAGEMANGIASEALVEAVARAGMIGFFGAAGLSPQRIEAAIDRVQHSIGTGRLPLPFGFNLIHSPSEPDLEWTVADLYLRRGVRTVSASAYLDLTPPLVRYRVSGLRRDADGRIVARNRVVAKVSRVEVARKFFSPPPQAMLAGLVERGAITHEEAALAAHIPMAEDLTAEADSGGHTDNRPLVALLPTMLALRDEMQGKHGFAVRLRVGAAGGISTPSSTAAAFAMGAAYVMTGSVNQCSIEAGTSDAVKEMLAKAGQADVIMAPAADMFEMGVKVQVLKWGTMFAPRAAKLYEVYRAYESLEAIPDSVRTSLERDCFKSTVEEAWALTRAFFEKRDPRQIERAEREPRHKMALVFRAYLGQASKWAITGDTTRRADYQVWCGPAMGAFNEWVRGTFLEPPARRDAVTIAMNLMWGAAITTRIGWLRAQGIVLPAAAERVPPMTVEQMSAAVV